MKRFLFFVLISFLLSISPITGCSKSKTISRTEFKLDTIVSITLYNCSDETVLDKAMDEIDRLESILSENGQPLLSLAQNAGIQYVSLPSETIELLKLSKEYYQLSEGLFDPTIQPLVKLWDINGEGHFPSDSELKENLSLVDANSMVFENDTVYLKKEGMSVTLGGVAKGAIADKIKSLLLSEGITSGVIDLGHNVLLIGSKPDGSDFRVGVQDPSGVENSVAEIVSAADKSIVTSGVYERYFESGGKKYHHILNPKTGFPADTGLSSVTIISDSSADGDALSTSCLLLGEDAAVGLIESLDGVSAIFIRDDGSIRKVN